MHFSDILNNYAPYGTMLENLKKNVSPIGISGVTESAQGQLISQVCGDIQAPALVLCYSDMEAKALAADLSFYRDRVFYFPSKESVFYNIETTGHENEHRRLRILYEMGKAKDWIVVASLDAVMQYTAGADRFLESLLLFRVGARFDLEELCTKLVSMGYTREELVEGKGQFSLRGGILDVFSPHGENPLRVEFFDDEVDSVRVFDPDSQRSLEMVEEETVIPCVEAIYGQERKEAILERLAQQIKKARRKKTDQTELIETLEADALSFSERHYFPSIDKYVSWVYDEIPTVFDHVGDSLVFIIDPRRIAERVKTFQWEKGEVVSELKVKHILPPEKMEFWADYQKLVTEMTARPLIALDVLSHTKGDFPYRYLCDFTTKTTVSFHGKVDYLYDDLKNWQNKNSTVVILAQNRAKGENLAGVLKERGISCVLSEDGSFAPGVVTITEGTLSKGFEYPEIKFVLVSDKEIFESKERRSKRRIENTQRIKSYNDIHVGDYVVHQSHGIGIYDGIKKITVNGTTKDYLKIQYKGTDLLYVPVDQLDLLYKYSGNTEKELKLSRLGGTEWTKTKQKVKKSTADMAKQLLALYAEREKTKGHAFSPDTVWQRDFEDAFPYRETDDQLRSIEEVKADMEKERPMDRLLCGDVGFGKTEVALRAAFKAVNDSKQVAYLCPTTILAMQHFNTFSRRMENFPVKVEMLSRFRTAAQQKKILKQLKSGEIDVLIGTHRILQKDLEFHDLGLLIVDEEQRFGVVHKEKLKELKKNVDVLTMTATPIPRTLHMSMISVRDMSVLSEPPENRYPVQTYVLEDNSAVLIDAIRNELSRGGQVFYLYNRVQGIYRKAEWIKSFLPEARIAVGHGKMKEEELEDIMYDMVNGNTDILVCTTIIETGLDIPNANTIIIEDADRMGLAQLYQLRGRVGRSNRAAYAYLTYRRDKMLSDVAQKRLRAVKEFTEFGSGFKIAMRDLEIRGAGNLIGAEQHGHMDAVGYDMYCKLLQESVEELKGMKHKEEFSVLMDLNVNAYLPDRYIRDNGQRIDIYKKIAAITSEEDRTEIEDELIDRYGDIPKPAENVIEIASIKALAKQAGICEVSQKAGALLLKCMPEALEPQTILALGAQYPGRIKLVSQENPVLHYSMKNPADVLGEAKKVITIMAELAQKKEVEQQEGR